MKGFLLPAVLYFLISHNKHIIKLLYIIILCKIFFIFLCRRQESNLRCLPLGYQILSLMRFNLLRHACICTEDGTRTHKPLVSKTRHSTNSFLWHFCIKWERTESNRHLCQDYRFTICCHKPIVASLPYVNTC